MMSSLQSISCTLYVRPAPDRLSVRNPRSGMVVDEVPADGESLAIVRAIVGLAKNLGFTVTAEGIETREQATQLHGMDCDMLQGYHFSRPVAAAEIDALLGREWMGEIPAASVR